MIIEIINRDIWEVKVVQDNGYTSIKVLDTYDEVTSFIAGLLAAYHPHQKKIEDYGSGV